MAWSKDWNSPPALPVINDEQSINNEKYSGNNQEGHSNKTN